MLRIFKCFLVWLFTSLFGKRPAISVQYIEDDPERLMQRVIYLVGNKAHPWKAVILCPCGCAATIELNLAPPGPPLWQIAFSGKSRITIHPSIWRKTGCCSHFWIREGNVEWCDSTTLSAC